MSPDDVDKDRALSRRDSLLQHQPFSWESSSGFEDEEDDEEEDEDDFHQQNGEYAQLQLIGLFTLCFDPITCMSNMLYVRRRQFSVK